LRLVKIRIAFSLIIFLLFLVLFLSGEKIAAALSPFLLSFQLAPALLKVISNPGFLAIAALIFLLIITMLFGRVYCSFLCPLGALQDFFIALPRKIGWQQKHSYQKPLNWLRYSILALTTVTALLGSLILLILLDPYSLTGRIISHLVEPVFVWTYNKIIALPKLFHIYFFFKETAYVPLSLFLLTLAFLLLILFMSLRWGRLYCNSICPVGTILGLISRFSFFKFDIDETSCSECSSCETVCKAGCIDPENKKIDSTRCVGCFNCIASCPQPAINYKPVLFSTTRITWSPQRRGFIIGSAAAVGAVLFAFHNRIRAAVASTLPYQKQPVTPPGSVELKRFTQLCSACPTKVLTPTFWEYGIAGLMQPLMDFDRSFCDYECNTCGQACPTGAILPLKLEEKNWLR